MPKYICLWVLTFTLLATPLCKADNELEIGGLLLDNTKSRLGHDFFYEFSRFWQDIPNKEGINVQIIEQIVPRAGTRLRMLLNGRAIYATHFGRRQTPVKNKVEQAILILIDAMARSQYGQDSPDMIGDGL